MSEPAPIVLVVDDDANFRRALHRLLQTEALQVELFSSAEELLKRCPLDGPGCILLDLQLPRRSGLDLQAEFAARGITTPIVFLTGHGDIGSSVTAMKAGAVDFLTKPVQKAALMAALAQAFARDRTRRAADARKREALVRLRSLTPRETDVLRLVIAGMLNKQIAGQLGTSEATIKIHRGRVMQKMQVTSVADLVRAAEAAGVHAVTPGGDPAARPADPKLDRLDASRKTRPSDTGAGQSYQQKV
jgi:FixJ family two-component response regulator